jgi:hypothetical protein
MRASSHAGPSARFGVAAARWLTDLHPFPQDAVTELQHLSKGSRTMRRLPTLLAALVVATLGLTAPAAAQSCEDAPSDGMQEGCEGIFGADEEEAPEEDGTGEEGAPEDGGTEDEEAPEDEEGGGLPIGGDEEEAPEDGGTAEEGESGETGDEGGVEGDDGSGGDTTAAPAQADPGGSGGTLPTTGGPALGLVASLLAAAGAGLGVLRRRLG